MRNRIADRREKQRSDIAADDGLQCLSDHADPFGLRLQRHPGEAWLCGTARAFSDEVRALIRERMRAICAGMAAAYQCAIEADIRDIFSVLVNQEEQARVVETHLGIEIRKDVNTKPVQQLGRYVKLLGPKLDRLPAPKGKGPQGLSVSA